MYGHSYTLNVMSWRDLILTAGTFVFIVGLLPSVFSNDKPALATSLVTGTTLLVFTVIYLTLSLWFTALLTAVIAGLWFTLAIQRWRMGRKR